MRNDQAMQGIFKGKIREAHPVPRRREDPYPRDYRIGHSHRRHDRLQRPGGQGPARIYGEQGLRRHDLDLGPEPDERIPHPHRGLARR